MEIFNPPFFVSPCVFLFARMPTLEELYMVFSIFRSEDRSWVVSHDGRSISKHASFEEAEKIARLLSKDLGGQVELLDVQYSPREGKVYLKTPTNLYQ